MNPREFLDKLSVITRSSDWRLSFVPFIMGCVYLWLYLFNISFDICSLKLLSLSVLTTFGFASLGYFINEFFDKSVDAKAGKLNKLVPLPWYAEASLFLCILLITFLPWQWLPKDEISYALISIEMTLFLLYSFPFFRLKNVYWLSGFIDSGYAYLVPLLLAYHTFSLYAHQTIGNVIWVFMLAVFFIGFRNITIHHINDIFKDKQAGVTTLPQKLGVSRTNKLIISLMIWEGLSILTTSLLLGFNHPLFFLTSIMYLLFWILNLPIVFYHSRQPHFAIHPLRHFTDNIYQVWFPLLTLLALISLNLWWLCLIPFHLLILVPEFVKSKAKKRLHSFYRDGVIPFSSFIINYSIYALFRLVGVNLIKENTSAFVYIKQRFRL